MDELKQSNQEKLKILAPLDSKFLKDVFWRFANKRSIKELKHEFIVDDENRHQVAQFVAYFSNDFETLEKYNMDFRKGLIIIGNPGSGKSLLFRIMSDIFKSDLTVNYGEREIPLRKFYNHFNMYTCEHMAKLFIKDGETALAPFGKNAVVLENKEVINLRHACFDDLGSEEMRNSFGNKKEVMLDIVSERYDLFLEYGLKTHFTSNLSPDEVSSRYGDRMRSRIRHMCNVIQLGTNKDYLDRR